MRREVLVRARAMNGGSNQFVSGVRTPHFRRSFRTEPDPTGGGPGFVVGHRPWSEPGTLMCRR